MTGVDTHPLRSENAAFLEHLEHDRGNSARTRNLRLTAIRSLLRRHAPRCAVLIEDCLYAGRGVGGRSRSIAQRLGEHLERVSYDAPIRSAEDIGATPLAGRVVNVKPSRIGTLRALFEVYARCARERRPMYGGGMGELGVGRGQIELLAALFHADAPNDVAPSAYNEDDPAGGLPASPLAPRPEATGFRWAA